MGFLGLFKSKKKEKVMKYNVLFALYNPGADLAGTFYNVLNEPNSTVRLGQYYTSLTREGVESILVSEQIDVAFIPDIFSDGNRVGKGTLKKLFEMSKKTRFYFVMTDGMDGTPDGVKRRKRVRLAELYKDGFYNVIFGEDCDYYYLRDLIGLDSGRTKEEAYVYYGLDTAEDIPNPGVPETNAQAQGAADTSYEDEEQPVKAKAQPPVQESAAVNVGQPQNEPQSQNAQNVQNVQKVSRVGTEEMADGVQADKIRKSNVQRDMSGQSQQGSSRGDIGAQPQPQARPINGARQNEEVRHQQQIPPVQPMQNIQYAEQPSQTASYNPSDNANLPTLGGFSAPVSFNKAAPLSVNVHIDFCVNQRTAIITFPEEYDVTQCNNRWAILTFIGGM